MIPNVFEWAFESPRKAVTATVSILFVLALFRSGATEWITTPTADAMHHIGLALTAWEGVLITSALLMFHLAMKSNNTTAVEALASRRP